MLGRTHIALARARYTGHRQAGETGSVFHWYRILVGDWYEGPRTVHLEAGSPSAWLKYPVSEKSNDIPSILNINLQYYMTRHVRPIFPY